MLSMLLDEMISPVISDQVSARRPEISIQSIFHWRGGTLQKQLDAFVLQAWAESAGAEGKVTMLADGNGEFAKALDLTFDGSGNGLGTRSKRYAMVVEDGVVKTLNVEDAPGKADISGADNLLTMM